MYTHTRVLNSALSTLNTLKKLNTVQFAIAIAVLLWKTTAFLWKKTRLPLLRLAKAAVWVVLQEISLLEQEFMVADNAGTASAVPAVPATSADVPAVPAVPATSAEPAVTTSISPVENSQHENKSRPAKTKTESKPEAVSDGETKPRSRGRSSGTGSIGRRKKNEVSATIETQ